VRSGRNRVGKCSRVGRRRRRAGRGAARNSEVASHVGHLPSFQASNRRPRNGPTAHVFLHQAAVGGGDHQAAIVWRSRAERTRGTGRERATVMHVAQCAVSTASFSLRRLKVIFLRILTRVPSGFFDVWLVSLHQPVFDNPALALGGVQLTLGIRCLGSRRLAKRERPIRVPPRHGAQHAGEPHLGFQVDRAGLVLASTIGDGGGGEGSLHQCAVPGWLRSSLRPGRSRCRSTVCSVRRRISLSKRLSIPDTLPSGHLAATHCWTARTPSASRFKDAHAESVPSRWRPMGVVSSLSPTRLCRSEPTPRLGQGPEPTTSGGCPSPWTGPAPDAAGPMTRPRARTRAEDLLLPGVRGVVRAR
jgi:hypothetical protein